MSGQNASLLNLPPGIFNNGTQYSVGKRWFKGNQIRWYTDLLSPVGGWVKTYTYPSTYAIRDMFSWRDYLKVPWMAAGSMDKLFGSLVQGPGLYTHYDITPVGLFWTVPASIGYGADAYGAGPYGMTATVPDVDSTGVWSMDNFGRNLFAIHSQDGRLYVWDPTTPATKAIVQTGAPVNNTIVIATEEEHLMVMGGDGKPRRVDWCSQRDPTDWTPTETNSAGGFELQSNGTILTAIRVQGGILVLTDTDAHMIEYLGAPLYYGRRRISENSTCLGKNCVTAIPQGIIWVGVGNFWKYDGNISELPCDVHDDVFFRSNLDLPSRLTLSTNQHSQEIWFSYPTPGAVEANKYALWSYSNPTYWSEGDIPRTAWLNPVWTDKPLACNGKDLYEHEIGWLADGVSRNGIVYAETGAIEIDEGDRVARVDRIWPNFQNIETATADLAAASLTFKLRQAPNGPERIYGPITLDSPKGYKTIRFRARQACIRVSQLKDEFWVMGKVRIRRKPGGLR